MCRRSEILTVLVLPVFDTLFYERKYKFTQLISNYNSTLVHKYYVVHLLAACAYDINPT